MFQVKYLHIVVGNLFERLTFTNLNTFKYGKRLNKNLW